MPVSRINILHLFKFYFPRKALNRYLKDIFKVRPALLPRCALDSKPQVQQPCNQREAIPGYTVFSDTSLRLCTQSLGRRDQANPGPPTGDAHVPMLQHLKSGFVLSPLQLREKAGRRGDSFPEPAIPGDIKHNILTLIRKRTRVLFHSLRVAILAYPQHCKTVHDLLTCAFRELLQLWTI